MNVRKWLGMDVVDLLIQAAVTLSVCLWVGVAGGPEELFSVIVGASFVVWGVRRHFTLKRMAREDVLEGASERVADLEDRVRDMESLQDRVMELEERLDFTERLLARQHEPGQLPK